ncbi:MAG: hypothetical protein ACLFWB_13675 [Armatimonadota bacterium]
MTDGAEKSNSARRIDFWSRILGILVFVAGIVMLIMVFMWAHDLVVSIDAGMLGVEQVSQAPADSAGAEGAVSASPGGNSLVAVGASVVLRFIGLLALGWLGAMVASKGAEMSSSAGSSGNA